MALEEAPLYTTTWCDRCLALIHPCTDGARVLESFLLVWTQMVDFDPILNAIYMDCTIESA